MALAKGVNKRVAVKKETTWGTPAGASGAKYLRRVTASFNLKKETYESNEIRTDYQVADFRHGVRSTEGTLSGELSPGSYADFMAAVLAKDFATVSAITALTLSIAAAGTLYTVTRSAGDWIVDGVRVGDVIALSGGSLNAANVGNNIVVVAMTSTVLTVLCTSSTALFVQAGVAGCTATIRGKTTLAPLTGHTDDSFTFEEWYSDITQSEVYTGNKVGSMAVKLPATGLVTVDFNFMGKNLEQTGTSQYFTTPTAAGTTGICAAVSGALIVNGAAVAVVTSMDFTVERGLEAANVVGSNFAASVFTGRIKATGNMSVYFQDGVFRDLYNNETVASVVVALSTDSSKTADVITFTFPRVKLGSGSKNDGEMGIVQDSSFTALLNTDTTAGLPATTIKINDTAAP